MSFQAYLDNIQSKTGKTPNEFIAMAKKKEAHTVEGHHRVADAGRRTRARPRKSARLGHSERSEVHGPADHRVAPRRLRCVDPGWDIPEASGEEVRNLRADALSKLDPRGGVPKHCIRTFLV